MNRISESQFEWLISKSDSILRKFKGNNFIMGISALHILNSHPDIQKKYLNIFYKKNLGIIFFKYVYLHFYAFLRFVALFFKKGNTRADDIHHNTEILFISHLINFDQNLAEDFYFGNLPFYLRKKGFNVTVLLINHIKKKKYINIEIKGCNFISMPTIFSISNEWKLYINSFKYSLYFFLQGLKKADIHSNRFYINVSFNAISDSTLFALRTFYIIKNYIKSSKIQTIFLTWEGHAWERLVCASANSSVRKVKIVGYSFTNLFPSSYALMRPLSVNYNPSFILTSGLVSQAKISNNIFGSNTKVLCFGTHKKNVYDIGNIYLKHFNFCLVAPEGLAVESYKLFIFAIKVALLLPNIKFVFRCHPNLQFSCLQKLYKDLSILPSNVFISNKKSLIEDFMDCKWLLYRSSSVAITAVLNGLRPIHYHDEGELNIDPLYELKRWRVIANSPLEVVDCIQLDVDRKNNFSEDLDFNEAFTYCNCYFMDVNYSVINSILKEPIH